MVSFYEDKPLDLSTGSMRLIRILKGDTGPIECEISNTHLSQADHDPYEALSYVWGNKESADKIWVNDRLFTVTESLFEALSNLRQSGEDRLLWIDAICINQDDPAERGHQVGQMRRIYQNADNVIIWLGPSTQEIDCLFSWMRCLENMVFSPAEKSFFSNVFAKFDPDETIAWEYYWSLISGPRGTKTDPSAVKEGLEILLGREWFSRIWVIQEAALARTATISSGRNDISSQTFVMMPQLLCISCNENVQSRLEVMPGLLRKTSWWSESESHGLDTLLKKFGKSRATDPRDIIYALLGLSKDAYTSDLLRPDYQICLQDAIQRTVGYLLIRSGHTKRYIYPTFDDLPRWNMNQLLSALNDLPSHVHVGLLHGRIPIETVESVPLAAVRQATPEMLTGSLAGCVPIAASPWTEISRKWVGHQNASRAGNGDDGSSR